MNTPTISRNSRLSVCAWCLSLLFHVLLFGLFACLHFYGTDADPENHSASMVELKTVRQIINNTYVVPKPSIRSVNLLSSGHIPVQVDLDSISAGIISHDSFTGGDLSSSSGFESPDISGQGGAEFFGSFTRCRKICYVVDFSGSMQGRVGLVKDRLRRSINSLQADNFFYVIFVSGGKLYESGYGRMHRGSPQSKQQVCKFIDSAKAEYSGDIRAGVKRAMEIRDWQGGSAELIYFLTDGFDLAGESSEFSVKIESMRKILAPAIRINTIGFTVKPEDMSVLSEIAKKSGGECVFVNY